MFEQKEHFAYIVATGACYTQIKIEIRFIAISDLIKIIIIKSNKQN